MYHKHTQSLHTDHTVGIYVFVSYDYYKKWRQCLNRLALIEKMLYGFCAVRTESLMQLSLVLILTCRAMTQTVCRWPLIAESWVRSQFSLREIFYAQSGTGTGHSPSTWAFPYHYNSTYDAYSSSSTRCSYQKDKRATTGIFPLSNALWEIGEHWIEKNFHFLVYDKIWRLHRSSPFPLK